jgi:hypothetical protein
MAARFRTVSVVLLLLCAGAGVFFTRTASAASLSLGPSTGSLQVGSTFDLSIFLDTEKESVNAVDILLSFPPDKLQLVTPSAGNSIVGVWTAQPKFNNIDGQVEFQGGMPGGVSVSRGLISTLTFRVRSVGSALVKLLDKSRVLLDDGKGTDALVNLSSGFYQLVLPPPAGPIVVSESHPVQSEWYANPNVVFTWGAESDVQGYSYIMNDEPADIVDDVSEGLRNSVTYRGVADGTHYFHIKALRNGTWGGTTHYAVRVDTAPPANFPIDIIPGERTVRVQPIIQFQTSDANSGIDHYELKIVPLTPNIAAAEDRPGDETLFIEAQSPYLPPPLQIGDYDVIVRAYDVAKNYREVTAHVSIVPQVLEFVDGKGLSIRNIAVLPWNAVWAIAAALLTLLGIVAWRVRLWHLRVEARRAERQLPDELRRQLDELQRYRAKYGSALLVLLLIGSFIMGAPPARADDSVGIAPPVITTVSRDISNEEIFYVGGRTENPQTDVTLFLQDLRTGETNSMRLASGRNGEWFYRHQTFLPAGSYLLWAQAGIGEEKSPPSPQVQFTVEQTAFQIGSTRISFTTLYLILIVVLSIILLGLLAMIVYHAMQGKRKHAAFMKEVKEAEESVRRGFAVLRRDIGAELEVVKRAKLSKQLSDEEEAKETQLMRDLEWVERYIGKEVWDVEKSSPR